MKSFLTENNKIITVFLVLIICFNFLSQIFFYQEEIFKKFVPKVWEDKYNKSQWIVPESKNPIGDDELYIHVGYLLTNGHDPSLINAEVPPLGKYLIGFFNSTTGYLGIYGVSFSALSLVLFYLLNKILFKSSLLALLPVALFSFEGLFKEQIGVALLDSAYLSFLLLSFIFFLKEKYLWTGVAAGLFMATKSPFLIVILYLSFFIFLFLKKELDLKKIIFMPLLTFIVYTLSHLQLFLLGQDLRYFLSVQNFMLHFYQTGAKGVFGAVIPLVLGGYWFTWFDKDAFIRQWNILWPIASLFSLWAGFLMFKERKFTSPFFFLFIWIVLYFGFLCLTPIFPRYLLLVLPFLYNLLVWALFQNIKKG